MLRGIVSRALGGGRRGVAAPGGATRRPAAGRPAAGGSANREIERGARSLLRGLGRKRRGL